MVEGIFIVLETVIFYGRHICMPHTLMLIIVMYNLCYGSVQYMLYLGSGCFTLYIYFIYASNSSQSNFIVGFGYLVDTY